MPNVDLASQFIIVFTSFSFSFFSSLSLCLSFAHSIRMVSIFVDKFITKLLTIDTGFWSKFQRIISVNGFQFKIKRERSIKNSLYRFDLWPAVNIIQNGYDLFVAAAAAATVNMNHPIICSEKSVGWCVYCVRRVRRINETSLKISYVKTIHFWEMFISISLWIQYTLSCMHTKTTISIFIDNLGQKH